MPNAERELYQSGRVQVLHEPNAASGPSRLGNELRANKGFNFGLGVDMGVEMSQSQSVTVPVNDPIEAARIYQKMMAEG